MANCCLGLYVEDKLIKYAKVSKEQEALKIDSYGIKFYDNINDAIEQILQETYSYNIPKSINLSGELYTYFDAFSTLSKKDFNNLIKTSFEIFCEGNNLRVNNYETRFLSQKSTDDEDKEKIINIAIDKNKLLERTAGNIPKLSFAMSLPISILNLMNADSISNYAVINLEQETTITLVSSGRIIRILTLENGMNNIINTLAERVNSTSKAYEILKDMTIYTEAGRELAEDNDEYLTDVMPILYNISEQIKKAFMDEEISVDTIWLTGTGAMINNVDLYFGEIFNGVKCEIIKPFFIEALSGFQANIKDYIEVNSAIALAVDGVDSKNKDINFVKKNITDYLKIEKKDKTKKANAKSDSDNKKIGNLLKDKINIKDKLTITNNLTTPLDRKEKLLIVASEFFLITTIVYCCISKDVLKKINSKTDVINNYIAKTKNEISKIEVDSMALQEKKKDYDNATSELTKNRDELKEKYKKINVIPNFLNQFMYIVPTEVLITNIQVVNSGEVFIDNSSPEIDEENANNNGEDVTEENMPQEENTQETQINEAEVAVSTNENGQVIQITAESPYYDELGVLIAKLKNGPDGEGAMLSNIKTEVLDSSLELISIKITGELN